MWWSKKLNVSLQNEVQWKFKVTENGNSRVQVPQNVPKYSTWLNVLSYIPSFPLMRSF